MKNEKVKNEEVKRRNVMITMKTNRSFLQRIMLMTLSFVVCGLSFYPANAQVGTWRAYMAYSEPQQIVKGGNVLYVRASNSLYEYDLRDESIRTHDKTTGLNDTDIRLIGWNDKVKRLIIVYENANIDLMDSSGEVWNISALYRKTMTDNKTIDSLTIDGVFAYLYARFGIVKVNMERTEISETYRKNSPEYPSTLPYSTVNKDWDVYIDRVRRLKPGGPAHNSFGFMRLHGDKIYAVNKVMEEKVGVQVYDGDAWTVYENDIEDSIGHRFVGLNAVDVDPTDVNHVIAVGQTGVYEFRDGLFVKEHTNDNSPLETASTVGNNNKDYVVVTGAKYDSKGNFWCLNSISPTMSLLSLGTDGRWKTMPHKELMQYDDRSLEQMEDIMFDSKGRMWFVNNFYRTPALLRYDTENDKVKRYDTFVNQDGTNYTLGAVSCVMEDLEGNIWIGTTQGPFYLPAANIDSDDGTFYQVKVPRNDGTDFADYLLGGVHISSMAMDGGGRKWFGTRGNGVYLISADNMTQVEHFTASNSHLLSDNIRCICIREKTGEVFFGTENGLCSYQSDATTPVETMDGDNVYAYPNPVTPDYTGLITVVGLSLNADVKICSSNGKLVAEGRSNGGTFTWDGKDGSGRRVASGVYMVMTATSDGHQGMVCKIAVIN